MTIWPPPREALKRPAYRSLARWLIEAIEADEIGPGTRLPTHRALAFQLGLSVHTVSRAYDELSRLGFITGEVGRGSFVAAGRKEPEVPWYRVASGEDIIDCSMLAPVTGQIQAQRLSAALRALADHLAPAVLFSFRPRATLSQHTAHARRWLAGCGLDVPADVIIPTNGNTSAMTIALMTAAIPGDLVVTEELGHHTLKSLTSALGLRLSGLAIDGEGIVPEALERACATSPVKVLYVMPNGLGPTAAFMGASRRAMLCEIARRNDVFIVENDAWGPLATERPEPLAALAPERTLYFTGLTKCLLPGLRIGWLVVPEAMIAAARTRHLVTNWMATPLIAEIASRWLLDGTAVELLRWQREQVARRNSIASRSLAELPHRASPNGLHLWLPLPGVWREDAFVAHARHNGVAVAAGSSFAISDGPLPPGIRICIGAGSESDIAEGVSTLARLARNAPEPVLLAI